MNPPMLHPPGNKALYPCEKGSESSEIGEPSQVKTSNKSHKRVVFVPWMQSRRIHIYLHLVECYGECRYSKYTIHGSYGNLWLFIWQSSPWWAVFSLTKCGTTSWVAKTLFHNMFFHPASPRGVFHQLWMMSFHHLYVPLSLRHLQKDCCSCTALLFCVICCSTFISPLKNNMSSPTNTQEKHADRYTLWS